MDQSRFQEAQQAYEAGEFRVAAKGFLASATRGPDGNGAAYHMAGNALMRLRRYQDAVTVYAHALRDAIYDRRGAVWANLGAAYVELGDYTEAARSYEEAIEEPDYATPYKAYQGLAGALLERGRVEEAAVAYRKAALDPGNPDPGKGLVNLGLCFMALGRADDAIEAYQAALGFDQYEGRGKALANLGQAYVARGEYTEAIRAFEKSTQMHSHKLSPAASAAYATALGQLHAGESDGTVPRPADAPVTHEPGTLVADDASVARFLAEEPPTELLAAGKTGDVAASSEGAVATVTSPVSAAVEIEIEESEGSSAPVDRDTLDTNLGIGDEQAVADFFSVSEEELKARGREARRAERHSRGPHAVWRSVALVAVLVVAAMAGLIVAYQLGYGWPTQRQSVNNMMSAYQAGTAVDASWVAAPSKDIKKEMAKIPPVRSFTVDNVTQGATTSKVAVTVTPQSGAALHYTVALSREGVGWKVSAVDNDWSSAGD